MMPDSVWSFLSELSVSQSDSHFLPDNCLAFLSYCPSALMSSRLWCLLRVKKFSLLIVPFLLSPVLALMYLKAWSALAADQQVSLLGRVHGHFLFLFEFGKHC